MYNISLGSALLSSLLLISLILCPMAMPGQHQAFAQNSTMTRNLAKILTNDAIQALNHKDINGALENLRLIGQQFPQAFAQNSTMAMNLAKLLAGDAIQALNQKDINRALENLRLIGQELGISGNSVNLMNPSSGVAVRLK
ncbi:MAG: hypothetical protein WA364_21130 [Candidatus Nitrosopolaris sp.]